MLGGVVRYVCVVGVETGNGTLKFSIRNTGVFPKVEWEEYRNPTIVIQIS